MKLSLLFLFTLLLPLTTTQAPPPRNDLTCSLCKTVMELLDQYITDTTNEEAVKSLKMSLYIKYILLDC
jgi:hypothetical protein